MKRAFARIGLLGVTFALVSTGAVQFASASSAITKVTFEQGCPGEQVARFTPFIYLNTVECRFRPTMGKARTSRPNRTSQDVISTQTATQFTASLSTTLIGEGISEAHSEFLDPEATEAYKFTASATGTVETLEMLTNEAENTGVTSVTFGIYESNGGNPGPLIGEGTYTGTPPTNSWFGVSGLSIPVVAGTSYWIAIHGLGGYLFFNVGTPQGERWVHWTGSSTNLPPFSGSTWTYAASTDKPAFRGIGEASTGGTGGSGTTGPTGPTGPTGANGSNGANGTGGGGGGTNGSNGANGSNGQSGCGACALNGLATNFGKYTGAGSTGGLTPGKQESGGWTVVIHAPAGTEQEEADGVASFPIPLKSHEKVALNYRNEQESLEATPPCVGSPAEPVVEPVGNFCAYRGGNGAGSKEKGSGVGNVDKNVTSTPFFEAFNGDTITETGESGDGDDGVLLVFRTSQFSAETPVSALANESNLHAIGSWAVAAK